MLTEPFFKAQNLAESYKTVLEMIYLNIFIGYAILLKLNAVWIKNT